MIVVSKELRHPIKVVCHRTGLTSHAIRVWERRYGLICCKRTDSNRRLYSDEEIERLRLLKTLTDCGHRISQIAPLELPDLYELYKKEQPHPSAAKPPSMTLHATETECFACCLEAVKQLDSPKLNDLLEEARLRYGARSTLLRIVTPLVHEVGEAWRRGDLRVAHEHLATSVVRDYLSLCSRNQHLSANAPEIVLSTPSGQVHEVGALLAAAIARDLGWRATYLGPSLPAEEIAACAQTRKARAVALSMVYPSDDPNVPDELTKLRQLLPGETALLLGGRAAYGYHQTLRVPDVRLVLGLAEMEAALEELTR
jgi:MerR family transcriptional regulator, light-induced transcriptional regulator